MCLLTYVIGKRTRDQAKSTYKKNVLELVMGLLKKKTSQRMLKVCPKECFFASRIFL